MYVAHDQRHFALSNTLQQFDTCTQPLGPLRQSLFSCLTCNPPPASTDAANTPAALCYSCSISCHGEHDLVELFTKRDFVCDCGTTRLPRSAPCTLRLNEATGQKGGITGDTPRRDNKYNHNFAGKFCACGEDYDPAKEKGTMFQCLGLGTVKDGGCGEDWWHPECLMGLPRSRPSGPAHHSTDTKSATSNPDEHAPEAEEEQDELPLPAGFPQEDHFDHLICYKCVSSNPWIKSYASSPGFLHPVFHKTLSTDNVHAAPAVEGAAVSSSANTKRKAEDDQENDPSLVKKAKVDEHSTSPSIATKETVDQNSGTAPKHTSLPSPPDQPFSLFVKEDFRDHFCRCPECFPHLAKFPQLLEEEEAYEPPMSESDQGDANGVASVGSGSTYERGEALLSNVDRVRAIEGVMVYNQLRDKVKTFLQPFAESGQAVGAEDIKAYFEKLRGDDQAIKLAAAGAGGGQNGKDDDDGRKEQSGE